MSDLRAQVEALFGFDITTASGPVPSDNYVSRAAVLALIEARAEPRAEGLDVEHPDCGDRCACYVRGVDDEAEATRD